VEATGNWYRLAISACCLGAVFLTGACTTTNPPPPASSTSVSSAPLPIGEPRATVSPGDCRIDEARRASINARTSDFLRHMKPATPSDGTDGDSEDAAETPHLPDLPLFSMAGAGQTIPAGWQPWTVNRNKRPTSYALATADKRQVIHALADSSASGLYVPLTARDAGTLRWTWKTRDIIRKADNTEGPKEDSPLRIFVAFDGDKGSLPLKDQLMYEMARIATGRDVPYATLMYIWAGRKPAETILRNPHTDRVRMIVVDSGTQYANEWRCHVRDLRADYQRAFGADPGRVLAVGIMTDTDNTKSQAESWYGDIAID
jgi:hypothetical protein